MGYEVMLKKLKEKVFQANLDLVKHGMVIFTWGNVSGIDREKGLVVIKPSGVDYDKMTANDMVVVDLLTGELIEGNLRPSSDTPTHLEIYRRFKEVGGVTHTHSVYATAFAQAGMAIPALGTTQADYFYGDIPCTRELTKEEVETDYELSTGKVICDLFESARTDPMAVPAVLVKNHGPFAWGKDPAESVYHAVVAEKVAEMDFISLSLNPKTEMDQYIKDRHYFRKHGPNAYYGQDK